MIHDAGVIPEDFEKNIMIPKPKKVVADNCSDFRTLCLNTHASIILCGIIKNRIEEMLGKALRKDQFRFRKDKGNR